MTRIFLSIAACMGCAGVALLAAGAHGGGAGLLTTAGQVLLFHAPAVMAGSLARDEALVSPRLGAIALGLMTLGAALFAADLAAREWESARLFPMAAPVGGSTMIVGWAALALAVFLGRRS